MDDGDKIDESVEITLSKMAVALRQTDLSTDSVVRMGIALQKESLAIQIDIRKYIENLLDESKHLLKESKKESNKAYIVSSISLAASLIALGVGIYTVLITVYLL